MLLVLLFTINILAAIKGTSDLEILRCKPTTVYATLNQMYPSFLPSLPRPSHLLPHADDVWKASSAK